MIQRGFPSIVFFVNILIAYLTFSPTYQTNGEKSSQLEGYHWGSWSKTGLPCSVTCGRGVRCRVRHCLDSWGRVEERTQRCTAVEDYWSQARQCEPCEVRAECSSLPGWGLWSGWSSCELVEDRPKRPKIDRCLLGIKIRSRICNQPDPEKAPFGVPCSGSMNQTKSCRMRCDNRPIADPDNLWQRIALKVENDHRRGMRNFPRVLRRRVGDKVQMSCRTTGYKMAKKLTAMPKMNAGKYGELPAEVQVKWYKNGRLLNTFEPEALINPLRQPHGKYERTRRKIKGYITVEELIDEQNRWESLHPTTLPAWYDDELRFRSITLGDQGLYTCELIHTDFQVVAIFYSLVVIGAKYSAQSTDPFYLHSNLGALNALRLASVWLESAQIVWKHNGMEYSRGLAARASRRIERIAHLNRTHTGTWTCYLIVPETGPPSRSGTPWVRIKDRFLLHEFHLRVDTIHMGLWQMAQIPDSLRILRNLAITLTILCETILLAFLLNWWAARRWLGRSLTLAQKKNIIHEMVDNGSRLMLTARKRAAINRDRLLPLLIREHQRLEKANIHLTEKLVSPLVLEEEEDEVEEHSSGHGIIGRLKSITTGKKKFSQIFSGPKASIHSTRFSQTSGAVKNIFGIPRSASVGVGSMDGGTTRMKRKSTTPVRFQQGERGVSMSPSNKHEKPREGV